MSSLPLSIEKPTRFSSPGLERAVLRLGFVEKDELERLKRTPRNTKLLAAIESLGRIPREQLLAAIAEELSIETVLLAEVSELVRGIDSLTQEFVLRHRAFPLAVEGDAVVVALADPLDLETVSELEFLIQSPIQIKLAAESEIVSAISKFFLEGDDAEFDQLIDVGTVGESVEVLVSEHREGKDNINAVDAPPIVRLVNKVLSDAAQLGASDVHIEPSAGNLDIRFRIDGMMRSHLSVPKRLQPYVVSRIKLLSEMDITEKRRPQDGRFRIRTGRSSVRDIRVSSVPTPFGEKLVLRLLRTDLDGVSFDSLGIEGELEEQFSAALKGTDQIVIVTGPTGSGKTTTLYGALSFLKRGTNTVVTVEDPIEFQIEGITQIQVNPKVGVTFASGLRSILRQDPDVILVGEVRDLETAEIAFQAAQTGHIVLTTLHTNDAPSAVVRLADLGLEPFIIAGSLRAIVAQRLVRTICSACMERMDAAQAETVGAAYGIKTDSLKVGKGCAECEHSGYRGRLGVFSFLSVNEKVREIIREGGSEQEIAAAGRENGMVELHEAGLLLVEQGKTTIEEIERVVGVRLSSASRGSAVVDSGVSREAPKAPVTSSESEVRGSSGPIKSPEVPKRSGVERVSVAELAKAHSIVEAEQPAGNKVLVVDDDRGVRAVMAKTLRRASFEVTEASDGLDALDKLAEELPDAIVCDLEMPGLNGRELLEKLRSSDRTKEIPIIMLTGLDSEEAEMMLIEAGANDFVSKTASPALVVTRVRRLLG